MPVYINSLNSKGGIIIVINDDDDDDDHHLWANAFAMFWQHEI